MVLLLANLCTDQALGATNHARTPTICHLRPPMARCPSPPSMDVPSSPCCRFVPGSSTSHARLASTTYSAPAGEPIHRHRCSPPYTCRKKKTTTIGTKLLPREALFHLDTRKYWHVLLSTRMGLGE